MANSQKYHQLISPEPLTPSSKASDPKNTGWGAFARLLPKALGFFNELGVSKNIEDELKKMEGDIKKILPAGGGVLLCIAIREWAQQDFNGQRAQAPLEIHIAGTGTDAGTVLKNYLNAPRLVQGAPSGWRRKESFKWYTGDINNLQTLQVPF